MKFDAGATNCLDKTCKIGIMKESLNYSFFASIPSMSRNQNFRVILSHIGHEIASMSIESIDTSIASTLLNR